MTDTTPTAEQCLSVKEGYRVIACKPVTLEPGVGYVEDVCPLTEALTIRSAEDVRREALEEAAEVIDSCGYFSGADEIRNLIDTPAPSTDKTPNTAEAAQVLLDAHHEGTAKFGKGRSIEQVSIILSLLRALAAQTGGE